MCRSIKILLKTKLKVDSFIAYNTKKLTPTNNVVRQFVQESLMADKVVIYLFILVPLKTNVSFEAKQGIKKILLPAVTFLVQPGNEYQVALYTVLVYLTYWGGYTRRRKKKKKRAQVRGLL